MVSAEFSTTDEESVALFRRALAAFDPADGSLRARVTAGWPGFYPRVTPKPPAWPARRPGWPAG